MDKDYENFVGRMGSFEDVIDLDDNQELLHYGKLGMRWGKKSLNRRSKKASELHSKLNASQQNLKKVDDFYKSKGPVKYGFHIATAARKSQNQAVSTLQKRTKKNDVILEKSLNKLQNKYKVVYDVTTKTYDLVEK